MNIFENKGELLTNIEVIRTDLSASDIKSELRFSDFRNELLTNGIGSRFYKGYFWAIPVNDSLNLPVVKPMASELFVRQSNWEQTTIPEFDPETWFHLGISLVRDSIIFALRKKFAENNDVKLYTRYPNFIVYNKNMVASTTSLAYAWCGLAIDKILPIDSNNIAICPYLNYGAFEDTGKPIFDKNTKQQCLYKANRCKFDEYKNRLKSLTDLVFPLETKFSNKKLQFNSHVQISGV